MIIKALFWILLLTLFYSYLGYTLVLMAAASIKKVFTRKEYPETEFEPHVSIIIPAYNEAPYIRAKMENCHKLDYPPEKMEIIWVTDGSADNTLSILNEYRNIRIIHEIVRMGKADAINRAVKEAASDYIILTDANSMLNTGSIKALVKPLAVSFTGCTSGEKRISPSAVGSTAAAGEGIYWKYESFVKRLESYTGALPGAAGELFAFRKDLYRQLPSDTLLDDFTISMNIAASGSRVIYVPEAFSVEMSSASITEELKRKKRIATGGIQFMTRHPELLNPFRHGFLSFKYISHKILRWIIAPFTFPLLFILNILILAIPLYSGYFFKISLLVQILFYLMAISGVLLKNVNKRYKLLIVPFYIIMMNFAVIQGIASYFRGDYSVKWPKSDRQIF